MASGRNETLYIGVTGDLGRRIFLHKQKAVKGFTERYSVDKLVYVEVYEYIYDALKREKQLKKWNRAWKIDLIEKQNPNWDDLYEKISWV